MREAEHPYQETVQAMTRICSVLDQCQYPIDWREYPEELNLAKQHGLVIALGESDDILALQGAIRDEAGAYNGTEILIDPEGIVPVGTDGTIDPDIQELPTSIEGMRDLIARYDRSVPIKAEWCKEGSLHTWTISTLESIIHGYFTIMKDENPFCRAIVIPIGIEAKANG